jgi:D-alanyl-D-alanine dipeptidase
MKGKALLLVVFFILPWHALGAAGGAAPEGSSQRKILSPAESLKMLENNPDYTDLSTLPHVLFNLKYATSDNFMGINMYGPLKRAFLHKDAATKLRKAVEILQKERPGWSFLVFDALRPRSVQWLMWNRVKDTPQRKYVANAEIGSPHNYGMALDISLADEKGSELDMGTGFDSFTDLSEPQLEKKFVREGKLTPGQLENRLILRKVMTQAGFLPIAHEWWHFNALPEPEIRKKYKIVE